MNNKIVVYIPTESKEATYLSTKRFLGVPLFLKGILTLEEAEFSAITIIAPLSERRHILKAWNRHTKNRQLNPHFVWTPTNQKINTKILTDLMNTSDDQIVFLNANLLVTKEILSPWEKIKLGPGQNLQAIIDRGLPPLVKVCKEDLAKLKPYIQKSARRIEVLISKLIDETAPHPASSQWRSPVMLITRFTTTKETTRFMTEQIRSNTPGFIAKNINKRISLPISVVLARLRIGPNSITSFNMLVGLAASIGAAGRTYVGLIIGAILFQLASILDGCDGEVAKLTHRATKFGQYIDSISDNLALTGFITGLMIHKYRVSDHNPIAFLWGGALLVGFFILLATMIRFLKKNTDSASLVTFDKEYLQKLPTSYPKPIRLLIKYGKYLMKKECFSLLFLISAIFGVLPIWLYLATGATWICIAVLGYLNLSAHFAAKKAALTTGKVQRRKEMYEGDYETAIE